MDSNMIGLVLNELRNSSDFIDMARTKVADPIKDLGGNISESLHKTGLGKLGCQRYISYFMSL